MRDADSAVPPPDARGDEDDASPCRPYGTGDPLKFRRRGEVILPLFFPFSVSDTETIHPLQYWCVYMFRYLGRKKANIIFLGILRVLCDELHRMV